MTKSVDTSDEFRPRIPGFLLEYFIEQLLRCPIQAAAISVQRQFDTFEHQRGFRIGCISCVQISLFGFIEAPKAADSQATVLALRTATRRVAVPYAGPTRPPGKW